MSVTMNQKIKRKIIVFLLVLAMITIVYAAIVVAQQQTYSADKDGGDPDELGIYSKQGSLPALAKSIHQNSNVELEGDPDDYD